jgi:glycosyltransferase involved in cell wall biosynthesis
MNTTAAGQRANDVEVLVTTYNSPRTLRLVLLALARQSLTPTRVVVADDGSRFDTLDALRRTAPDLPFPLLHVWQPDIGFRLARSRNNALRQVRAPLVAILDQDVLPHRDWLAVHRRRGGPGRVGLGDTLDLPPAVAGTVTEADVREGRFETRHARVESARLARRHGKALFYALLRRMGLAARAKPKLRGSNFAVWMDDVRSVNGFDEEYMGWGQEDDDFGRRLYAAGVRPVVLIGLAPATHLGHETVRTTRWKDGPNVPRFRQDSPARCLRGLDDPRRDDAVVTELG